MTTITIQPSGLTSRLVEAVGVIDMVADYYNLLYGQVIGRCRALQFVRARYTAIHLIDKRLRMDPKDIAHIINRDESTVFYALNRAEDWLEVDPSFRSDIQRLKQELKVRAKREKMINKINHDRENLI